MMACLAPPYHPIHPALASTAAAAAVSGASAGAGRAAAAARLLAPMKLLTQDEAQRLDVSLMQVGGGVVDRGRRQWLTVCRLCACA
jgi:hypothetical protein